MIKTNFSLTFLALLPFVTFSVRAANDWKTPCFNGVCEYSISGDSSALVKIWGSPDAITDITSAAGWEILNCSPDELDQDIRLVCQGDENDESSCAHLYQNVGAEGKIVRLPESCGKSAFARIAKEWVPEDQSIPDNIAKRLVRRDGAPPVVKALRLDTNFAADDMWKKVGPVQIAIQGANFPGLDDDTIMNRIGNQRRRRSQGLSRRETDELVGDIIQAIQTKADEIKANANLVGSVNSLSVDKTIDFDPVDLTKSANLIDQRISCPNLDAGIKVDIDSRGSAKVSVGIAASGSLLPPKFNGFQLFGGLDADLDGTLTMAADITGVLDSGRIKIFELGVPGLSIPAIFSLGPTFTINAQTTADLDVNMDLTVGFKYTVPNGQLFFPPKDKQSGGDFQIGDTPLNITSALNGKANAVIKAHLIPGINFGVSALGGLAKAEVFLELDASATLNVDVEGSKEQTTGGETTKTGGGCVDMNAGLDVAAGARGKFFSLFDDQTQVSLFDKQFPLFKKCFDNGPATNSTKKAAKGETKGEDTQDTAEGEATTEDGSNDDTSAEGETTAEGEEAKEEDTATGDDATTDGEVTTDEDTAAEDETTAEGGETTDEEGEATETEAEVEPPVRRSRIWSRKASNLILTRRVPVKRQGVAGALKCLASIVAPTVLTQGTISQSQIKSV